MDSGIYVIENLVNGKVYVGSSNDIRKREREHFSELKRGNHYNTYLQKAYDKYGEEAFRFMTIELCNPTNLVVREDSWIAYYDSMNRDKGYNLCSANRREMSDETKIKISDSNKGQVPWNKGKTLSKEHRLKLSEANKGKTFSKETRMKMSITRKGRPARNKGVSPSEQSRKRMSDAQKGNQNALGYKHTKGTKKKISDTKKQSRMEYKDYDND